MYKITGNKISSFLLLGLLLGQRFGFSFKTSLLILLLAESDFSVKALELNVDTAEESLLQVKVAGILNETL